MNKEINQSRRQFLQRATGLGMTMVMTGALSRCTLAQPSSRKNETRTADQALQELLTGNQRYAATRLPCTLRPVLL
jgi:hypothetical protein